LGRDRRPGGCFGGRKDPSAGLGSHSGSNCGSVGSEIGTDLARTRHIRAGSVRTPWVGGGSGWDQEAVRRVAAA